MAGRTPDLTVDELILRYWGFAGEHPRLDGIPTGERDNIPDAMKLLRRLYGHTAAREFGPLALKSVRRAMLDSGLARSTVNSRASKIRRMFR